MLNMPIPGTEECEAWKVAVRKIAEDMPPAKSRNVTLTLAPDIIASLYRKPHTMVPKP